MLVKMETSTIGGGTDIVLAAIVCNQSTSEVTIDNDYVSISSNKSTITFNKKVKGYVYASTNSIQGGTATYQIKSSRRAYTDYIYEFNANVGDTLIFTTDFTYSGYSIVCIDD